MSAFYMSSGSTLQPQGIEGKTRKNKGHLVFYMSARSALQLQGIEPYKDI